MSMTPRIVMQNWNHKTVWHTVKTVKKDIPLEARCPECHQPLQVLKACGAVDYFCQNGHGLISKKRVEFVPV